MLDFFSCGSCICYMNSFTSLSDCFINSISDVIIICLSETSQILLLWVSASYIWRMETRDCLLSFYYKYIFYSNLKLGTLILLDNLWLLQEAFHFNALYEYRYKSYKIGFVCLFKASLVLYIYLPVPSSAL